MPHNKIFAVVLCWKFLYEAVAPSIRFAAAVRKKQQSEHSEAVVASLVSLLLFCSHGHLTETMIPRATKPHNMSFYKGTLFKLPTWATLIERISLQWWHSLVEGSVGLAFQERLKYCTWKWFCFWPNQCFACVFFLFFLHIYLHHCKTIQSMLYCRLSGFRTISDSLSFQFETCLS